LVGKAPKFIQKKVNRLKKPKWVSAVALFNTVFHVYPSENAFSDKINLPFVIK